MPRQVKVEVMPGCQRRIPTAELKRIAAIAMDMESVAPEFELDVVLADSDTVQDLNHHYRGLDEPTDVLSFPNEIDPAAAWPEERPSLGEIVVCVPVAEENARQLEKSVKGIIAHSLVHGVLHMIGYDHEDSDEESQRMQAREDEILAALGYNGQYEHGH